MKIESGQQFGKWTVIKENGRTSDRRRLWLCECSCGHRKNVVERYLRSGKSKSCGKCNHEDLTNKVFGKLTVVGLAYKTDRGVTTSTFWNCRCECGKFKQVRGDCLKSGITVHCGCSRRRNTALGKTDQAVDEAFPFYSRLNSIWFNMHDRCEKPSHAAYKNYGGRGIKVCEEWAEFKPFYEWAMLKGFSPKLTIDRADNNGDYSPDNCRWATRQEQAQNTRRTRLTDTAVLKIRKLIDQGVKQVKIAKAFDVTQTTISRIKYGKHWSNIKS